jgi:hypothetical protein
MRYTREGLTAELRVRDGVPVCVTLTLAAEKGVSTKDLRAVPLERLVKNAYEFAGLWDKRGDQWMKVIGPAATIRSREAVRGPVRRRYINEQLLAEVRELWDKTAGMDLRGDRVAAIAVKMSVSKRQAARYVSMAGL